MKTILKALSLGLMAATMAFPAMAQVDFAGKRIELLVPYAAGGGADLYARFLGPLIAERLPGKPTLIIKNVEGAGAIAGSNQFQDRAKPDGTDLIAGSASVMLNYAFRDPRGHYKLNEWIPIISSAQGTVVYVSPSLGIKDAAGIASLAGKDVVMGANNPTGGDLRVILAMDLLGVNIRPIFGMNRGDVYPAFQRGEVNLDFSINNAFNEQVQPLVDEGTAVPIMTLGFAADDGTVERDPAQPNLPHFLEVYKNVKGEELSGPAREAWDAVFNLNVMATRAILLPAGAPQDVQDTYKAALEQLLADFEANPDLKQQALKVLGTEPQALGEAAARNLRAAVVFSDPAYAWLGDWLKTKFDVKL
jgi:tripartite-type tricarboxylate transporter receptor subunit TctC